MNKKNQCKVSRRKNSIKCKHLNAYVERKNNICFFSSVFNKSFFILEILNNRKNAKIKKNEI